MNNVVTLDFASRQQIATRKMRRVRRRRTVTNETRWRSASRETGAVADASGLPGIDPSTGKVVLTLVVDLCPLSQIRSSLGPMTGGTAVQSGLTDEQIRVMTLEAFADTIIPGEKRSPDDRAIAGVSDGGGAVAAGAIELLETPATGVTAGLPHLAQALNAHAQAHAAEHELTLDESVPAFVALEFEHRAALVQKLTAPGHPEKDGWVLLALFSNMAFDVGAHLHTVDAIEAGHPGLVAIGFAKPDADGLWRFPNFSYNRQLARLHPDTTPSGSPA